MRSRSALGYTPLNNYLYQQFAALKAAGRKQEATAALNAFLVSFDAGADAFQVREGAAEAKRAWVYAFLEEHEYGHKIRHDLYARLIFPVLIDGYDQQDARSLYWLAATAQNLYDNRDLHTRIGAKTEMQLLREAYALQPMEAVSKRLLAVILNRLDYCQHEWPAGILYDSNGASLLQCEEILQEAAFAQTLDAGENAAFFAEFERRVREYKISLRERE